MTAYNISNMPSAMVRDEEEQRRAIFASCRRKKLWETLTLYAGTSLLCVATLYIVMDLGSGNLAVPFSAGGDSYFYSMVVKNLVENGKWYVNDFLGAPGRSELYDFPVPQFTQLAVLKLLSLFSSNFAVVLNLYFLLTFPLTAVASLAVLRHFDISPPSAVLASILFTFIPYHLMRGEVHLFLAAYYTIPLAILVALWLCTGKCLFHFQRTGGQPFITHNGAVALLICIITGMTEPYYAFFACWLLLVAAPAAKFRFGLRWAGWSAAILIAVVALSLTLALLPNFAYYRHAGRNPMVTERYPHEAEFYGLKITQLVLPATGHRLDGLAEVKQRYNEGTVPPYNESDTATLGLIGTCGFAGLLCYLALMAGGRASPLPSGLSILNAAAVLLGTIGGFGALFALFVSPQFRSLNRISVFIGFFCLFAVGLAFDRLGNHASRRIRMAAWVGVALLLALGIFDQTTDTFVPHYPDLETEYASDADFVGRIERAVPTHAMIFQLPYVPFPAYPPPNHMADYDELRGYLHSKTLRWSYGTMKGNREGDRWLRGVAAKPIDQLIQAVKAAGFSGLYIDRFGYADGAAELEAELSRILQERPEVSRNQRLSFFGLDGAFRENHKEDAAETQSSPRSAVNSDIQYLNSLYQELLFRSPDPGGLQNYLNELARGVSRDQVRQEIMSSREYRSKH